MCKISFVIPCYGSEHTLKDVVNEIEHTVDEQNQNLAKWDYEIILVNDCSPDNVWNVIENLCENNSKVKGIKLVKNFGQHSALMAGYNCATGDYIITLDDDGQTPANQAFRLINKLEEGYDFIQGSRFMKGGRAINTPVVRFISVQLIHAPIISLTAHQRFTDTTNAYRGYSARYLKDDRVQPLRDIFMTYELLAYLSVRATQIGMKACEVPVTRAYPKKGKTPTKISFFKGNSDLMKILLKNARGAYDPK